MEKNLFYVISFVYRKVIFRISGMFEFKYPAYFIRDPAIIKHLAVKEFDFFSDHRMIISEDVEPLFGKALFGMKGQKWRGEYLSEISIKIISNHLFNCQICEPQSVQHLRVSINERNDLDLNLHDIMLTKYFLLFFEAGHVKCETIC